MIAAGQGIGIGAQRVAVRSQRAAPEGWQAAAWMRAYFRHARTIERRLEREWDAAGTPLHPAPGGKVRKLPAGKGFRLQGRSLVLESTPGSEPAEDAETVLRAFAAMAQSGVPLAAESEERILAALPEICATLEVGPALWRRLCGILTAPFAGAALRSMHALGILELILPEFHGIDALVIRDAYHRYTVDEHTFVVIDTLHALAEEAAAGAPEWRLKFGSMIRGTAESRVAVPGSVTARHGQGAFERRACRGKRAPGEGRSGAAGDGPLRTRPWCCG